jgi:hypothetical protein
MSRGDQSTERAPVPWALICAGLAFMCGAALIVGGVFVLLGEGWALIAGALPCLLLSIVIARGLS